MNTTELPAAFHPIRAALTVANGMVNAFTLDDLAARAGVARREVEEIMEHHLADFGFSLVSGSAGYWRPEDAAELNRYIASLRSRALKCFRRAKRVTAAARRDGWPLHGRTFLNPPARQGELDFTTTNPQGNP